MVILYFIPITHCIGTTQLGMSAILARYYYYLNDAVLFSKLTLRGSLAVDLDVSL